MNYKRWLALNEAGKGLTPKDLHMGYHFCVEWDGLLIGPDMGEWDACGCFGEEKEKIYNNYPHSLPAQTSGSSSQGGPLF